MFNHSTLLKFMSTLDEPLQWFFRTTKMQRDDKTGKVKVLFTSKSSLEDNQIYDEYGHVGIRIMSEQIPN